MMMLSPSHQHNLELALSLAAQGVYVFPCRGSGPRRKQPCPGIMWKSQSTVDAVTIARWWRTWPDAVPGIDMGKSGLLAFDCDRGKPDDTHIVDALGWLREFARTHHGSVLGAPTSETPSGGMHVIYRNRAVNPFGNSRGNLPPKGEVPIDIRGAGGYIIAPGAIFADGGHYVAHGALIEAFPLPDWAVALLAPSASVPASVPASVRQSSDAATVATVATVAATPATTANSANSANSAASDATVATVATVAREKQGRSKGEAREKIQKSERVFSLRKNSWAEAALDGLVDDLAAALEGERNNRANELSYRAGRMVGGGLFGHSEALARLTSAALSWGIPPRDRVLGARGTIARALRDGASKAPAITGPEDDVPYVEDDGLIDVEALKANAARRRGDVSRETQPEIGDRVSDATLDDDPPEPPPPSIHDLVAGDWTHPDGLLGAIADWIESISRFPNRPLAVAAATAVLSTICGRHLYGPTGTALNLYFLLLGRPGIGKDKPLKAAQRLLTAAGFGVLAQNAAAFSLSAIERLIVDYPCCLGTVDEIVPNLLARALHRKASTHESSIRAPLMLLWSRTLGDPPYATTRKAGGVGSPPSVSVSWPSLTLLGASTEQAFYDALSSGQRTDGFMSRFMLCHAAPKAKEVRGDDDKEPEIPMELIMGLRALVPDISPEGDLAAKLGTFALTANLTKYQHRVPWANAEVKQVAREFEKQLDLIMEGNAKDAELLVRVFESAVRLATLHGAARIGLRLRAEVDEQDWAWGRAFALSSAQRMVDDFDKYVSDSDTQAMARDIRRKLLENGGRGMTHNKLIRALDSKYEPRKLTEMLRSLKESGQIRSTPVPTKGRTATHYNWVGG